MNIEVQANSIPTNKDVHRFVNWRSDLALNPFRDQIGQVSVFVDNTSESAKGKEMCCRVVIRPNAHPDVVVENTDANLYVAIHKAVDYAGWALASSLVRQQSDLLHQQIGMIDGKHSASNMYDYIASDRAA
jgi:ribosome-associated translation inhibitor RaiA